jgi:hypothetical protein
MFLYRGEMVAERDVLALSDKLQRLGNQDLRASHTQPRQPQSPWTC